MNLDHLQVATRSIAKVNLNIDIGRFTIRTIKTEAELKQAFQLRYQVFQVEMIGHQNTLGLDYDKYDAISDHLAVYDSKNQQMVATCRLNSSLFSQQFYSQQEFYCDSLIQRKETKLEIGRVCVHKDFRKGIVLMLFWRAFAEYMRQTETKILFGCGSVQTIDPLEAAILYQYLIEQNKVSRISDINPTENFSSIEFELNMLGLNRRLTIEESILAEKLLPSLCRSYFDIGCTVPCAPAFDREFKCIDFLTVLEVDQMNSKLRQKMFRN